jgi:hypothetical protein
MRIGKVSLVLCRSCSERKDEGLGIMLGLEGLTLLATCVQDLNRHRSSRCSRCSRCPRCPRCLELLQCRIEMRRGVELEIKRMGSVKVRGNLRPYRVIPEIMSIAVLITSLPRDYETWKSEEADYNF